MLLGRNDRSGKQDGGKKEERPVRFRPVADVHQWAQLFRKGRRDAPIRP